MRPGCACRSASIPPPATRQNRSAGEILFDPRGAVVELFGGKTKDGETLLVQIPCYPQGLGIKTAGGGDFVEKRGFDERHAR